MKTLLKYLVIAAFPVALVGCGEKVPTVTVGSKLFTESEILAEMIAQLAEQEGIPVERKLRFGNTNTVLEALKQGVLDVYPEYNGTSLTFLGQAPSSDSGKTTETANALFEPSGLELAGGFGFSNDYVMAMTSERAQELGVSKISDLATLSEPIVFSVETDFLERPADGLQQMQRRYGIRNSTHVAFPLTSEGKDQQVDALLDGEADVAELYGTDGQIAEYGLVLLEDDQNFFPVYDAMPLVRSEALANTPALGEVLGKLAGAITADDMQSLNKAVDLEAQSIPSVATGFLQSKGLLPEGAETSEADELLVAADLGAKRDSTLSRAMKSIRAGFKGTTLSLSRSVSPLDAIKDGTARVAIVGAESFYSLADGKPVKNNTAEAFAVIGYKTGHLISLRSGPSSITEMKRIGTGAQGTGSARVLEMVLTSLGLTDTEIVNSSTGLGYQIAQLSSGDIDGMFIMAAQGSRDMASTLKNSSVRLVDLNEWADGGHTATFSFLRPATIPVDTYTGQARGVASISTQYVLASPVERVQGAGEVGPGTAGTGEGGVVPIGGDTVTSIRESLGDADVIDPAVPTHASLVPTIQVADKSLPFAIDISIANILMVLFTIWVVYLCLLPSPRRFTMPEDED